ncbi:unnamed protein product [Dibothriocephalus latus]|uniref:RRM domain-containing protein n=1 Tax=Dibothriocephalus latus TaxID=60516 RepID=A0A3P7N5I6_DIBLA|nr:unnamed protein product [Dibothriocephalus latus]
MDETPSEHVPRQSKTIFVGQLKPKVTAADLKDYFSKYGTVSGVNLVKNKKTGESRGFAFVTFADEQAFDSGVLDTCHFLDGCRIIVNPRNCRDKTRGSSVQAQM